LQDLHTLQNEGEFVQTYRSGVEPPQSQSRVDINALFG